jgi:hypothetical protein
VSAARQVGGEKQTKQVSETAKRAAMRPEGGYVDLNLTREAAGVWFCAEIELKSEIPVETFRRKYPDFEPFEIPRVARPGAWLGTRYLSGP